MQVSEHQELRIPKPFKKRLKDVWLMGSIEVYHAGLPKKAAVLGTVAITTADWSPLNEYLAGSSAGITYNNTGVKESYLAMLHNSIHSEI